MLLQFIEANLKSKKQKCNQMMRFKKTISKILTIFVSVLVMAIGALFNRALKVGIDLTSLSFTERFVLVAVGILLCFIIFFTWLLYHVIEKKIDELKESTEEITLFIQRQGDYNE